jgi:hypothetical protein
MAPNTSISKDEEFIIYELIFTERYSNSVMSEIQKRYSFSIEFESLYGDKFSYKSDLPKPKEYI